MLTLEQQSVIISVVGVVAYGSLFLKYKAVKDGWARLFLLWLFGTLLAFFVFRILYLGADILGHINAEQRGDLAQFNTLLLLTPFIYELTNKDRHKK